jgi:7-cyano-7-deazaguanine synthase
MRSIPVPEAPTEGIPSTYVPARNSVFLALGMGVAEVLDADCTCSSASMPSTTRAIPDCRPEFIAAFQSLAALATRRAVEGAPLDLLRAL